MSKQVEHESSLRCRTGRGRGVYEFKDYDKYLMAINAANSMERERAKELLRGIYAQMVAQYGAGDSDVDYLYRKFRYSI